MSSPTTNCGQDDDIGRAASTMGRLRIRRLPVVNRAGFLVGILALDDIARHAAEDRDLLAPQVRPEVVARTLGEAARPRILVEEARTP
jgi:CBS domain-containing protein